MIVSHIAHASRPIKNGLIIHHHSRRPPRHDKLLLVARRMVIAARVTHVGKFLRQSRSLLLRVRVKEILQFELGLSCDLVLPQLGNDLGCHRALLGTNLRVSLICFKTASSASLLTPEQ